MYSALDQKILDMQSEIISGILENVSIISVKSSPEKNAPFGIGPKSALENALLQSERLGLKAVNVDDKIGYTEIGEGDEMVAILGHLDVVPLGDGWTKDPRGEQCSDRLYGRGVCDNKGPTIASLYVLKAIKDLGIDLKRRIRVIYGTDEETGFACVQHYIDSGQELPVFGFTPDANYPAIYAEKGAVGMRVSKKITQNPDFRILTLSGGVAKNVVTPAVIIRYQANTALLSDSTTVGDLSFEKNTLGISAHASMPEEGKNAFMILCEELNALGLSGDVFDVARFVSECFSFEANGESLGVFFEDETGKITLSIGMVDFIDDELSFTIDVRYPVTMDRNAFIEKMKAKTESYGLTFEVTKVTDPLYVPKDSALIHTLMDVYKEKCSTDDAEAIAIGGGTYAKAFKNMVAFGVEFPGETLPIHQVDEYILIENLIKSTQISAEAIVRLANQ